MAALSKFQIQIPATLQDQVPEPLYQPINDLYLAFNNLVEQLNRSAPVMMSPNGHFWVATISNAGAITWTDVGTVRP